MFKGRGCLARLIVGAVGFSASTPLFADALSPAQAAQVGIIRSSVEPGRIGQAQAAATETTPSLGAPASIAQPSVASLSPEAAQVTLHLTQIKVEGSTVFSEKQLITPFQSLIGKNITLGEVELIAEAMTERYERAGYILTKVIIPPQYIQNGVVTLRVVEGYVDSVSVQGNVWPGMRALLLKYGEKIQASRPLRLSVLERYALLANDLPGVNAKVVLQPSKTIPGAADLVFVVQQYYATGYLSADNRGTRFLGPQQLSAGGNLNSVLRSGDTIGVQALTTANKELNYVQLNNTEPLGSSGLQMLLNGSYTRSLPGSYLSAFEIKGESTSANGGLSYPIIRSRVQNLYVQGNIGLLDSRSIILDSQLYNDQIRFLNAGLTYDRIDHWRGFNQLGANVTQGLDIFGASSIETSSRPGTSPRFNKFNFNASRLQYLPRNFSIYLAGQGQYTTHPQYAAEQFGFGGPVFGRGYDPSEIVADKGWEAKVEFRYDRNANQYYVFSDAADMWNLNRSAQPGQLSAMSAGVGIRSNITRYLTGDIQVAQPLTRTVAAEHDKSTRFYFSLTVAGQKGVSPAVNKDNTPKPVPNNLQPQNMEANSAPAPEQPTQTKLSFWQQVKYKLARKPAAPGATSLAAATPATVNQHAVSQPRLASMQTRTTMAAASPATVTPSARNQKLQQINPDYYTIKLAEDHELDSAHYFIKHNKLGNSANYFAKTDATGHTHYILIYGQYSSREAAQAALAKLSQSTRITGAFITRYAAIQSEIAHNG